MTKSDAIQQAREEVERHGGRIAVVIEGPHADDFAEFDTDGHSYGYCPEKHVALLYRYGTLVEVIS